MYHYIIYDLFVPKWDMHRVIMLYHFRLVPYYSAIRIRSLSYRVLSRITEQFVKPRAMANGSFHGRGERKGVASQDPFSEAPNPRPLVKVPQIAQKNRERSFSAVTSPTSVIIGNFSSEILPCFSPFLSPSPPPFFLSVWIWLCHYDLIPRVFYGTAAIFSPDPLNCLHFQAASSFSPRISNPSKMLLFLSPSSHPPPPSPPLIAFALLKRRKSNGSWEDWRE